MATDYLRNSELAAIHVARKQLGLDEDTYRTMLASLTGQYSAKFLNQAQRRRVIDEMRRKGFARKTPPQAGKVRDLSEPQLRMIRGLWAELRKKGLLRDASERALNLFCKRVTGVEAVAWLAPAEANKVIEALKAWLARQT